MERGKYREKSEIELENVEDKERKINRKKDFNTERQIGRKREREGRKKKDGKRLKSQLQRERERMKK